MASSPLKSFLRPRDEARMTLIEHLDELRARIIKVGVVFVLASIVAWFFVGHIFEFMLFPADHFLHGKLAFRSVTEPIMTDIKLALYTGLMVTLPVLFYQLWAFVAPAVGEMGRMFTYTLILLASVLFVCGVAFGYFVVLPIAMHVLIGWAPSRYHEIISAQDYLRFVTRFLLAFGVAFEVPTATYVGAKLGLINAGVMRRYRKHAIMINAVLAAVITPADPFSMLLMAAPLLALYEFSILIAARVNPIPDTTLPEALDNEEEVEEERDRAGHDL